MPVSRLRLYFASVVLMLVGFDRLGSQIPATPKTDSAVRVTDDTARTLGSRPLSARPASALRLVTSEAVDRERSDQLLAGISLGEALLLRSASSLTPWTKTQRPRATPIPPDLLFVVNSALPFSQNNGSMWAGRGLSTRTLFGFRLEGSRARLIFAPELVLSANGDWSLLHDFYFPSLPADRKPFEFPYYVGRFTIDQPMRFGARAIRRLDLGQTTLLVSAKRLELGLSNESEWWGPGIRNAIVLSNNAPGFPHLFVRTGHPIGTRFGAVEMRWLVGGLTESQYFDTVSTNNTRSFAAIAATLQTAWDPNLSVGVARAVYGTAAGWGKVPWRWFDVFARTHRDIPDTTRTQRDQIVSLFGRWVFPADGVEVYGEWGRLQFRPSLRDLFIAPNHTQGYTLGLQWRGAEWRGGSVRLQAEITQLEESATFRDEPVGSWYTSTRVVQGYTNRGEVIGASIGPGASSQWLAADYLKPDWRIGVFAGRIRWNQDVHNNSHLPVYVGYCSEDVSLFPGIRGAKDGRFGSVTAELSLQNRLTPFFQNGGGCPNNGRRLDIRNNSLSITFFPFNRR